MSMNLHARNVHTGREVELYQTPTWVTYAAIEDWRFDEDGKPIKRYWKDTRKIYLEWVKSLRNGVFRTEEDMKRIDREVKEHIEDIMEYKELMFYIL